MLADDTGAPREGRGRLVVGVVGRTETGAGAYLRRAARMVAPPRGRGHRSQGRVGATWLRNRAQPSLDIRETLRRDLKGTSSPGRRRTRVTTSGGSACTSGLNLFRIRHIAAIQPAVPHPACPYQDLVQDGPNACGWSGPMSKGKSPQTLKPTTQRCVTSRRGDSDI